MDYGLRTVNDYFWTGLLTADDWMLDTGCCKLLLASTSYWLRTANDCFWTGLLTTDYYRLLLAAAHYWHIANLLFLAWDYFRCVPSSTSTKTHVSGLAYCGAGKGVQKVGGCVARGTSLNAYCVCVYIYIYIYIYVHTCTMYIYIPCVCTIYTYI